jgi:hypothetical protein
MPAARALCRIQLGSRFSFTWLKEQQRDRQCWFIGRYAPENGLSSCSFGSALHSK